MLERRSARGARWLLVALYACSAWACSAESSHAAPQLATSTPPGHAVAEHHFALASPSAKAAALVSPCIALCTNTSALDCALPQAACVEQCEALTRIEPCKAQAQAFIACAQQVALDEWGCGDEGPELREGVCAGDQEAFFTCVTPL